MEQTPLQRGFVGTKTRCLRCFLHRHISLTTTTLKQTVLLLFTAILLYISFVIPQQRPDAHAQEMTLATGYACNWHQVTTGQTLGQISHYYHANLWNIARTNHISNINLIFIGQHLCIPHRIAAAQNMASGLFISGNVRWYAYNALDWSTRSEVEQTIRQTAARYNLPANLMLAIAWQESGWTQHIIARDGGIGTMQIMPYTAQLLNRQVNGRYDPYKLQDNIELAAIYLSSLWHGFGGNKTNIISAYNEGGWNVLHRGIFNWPYVRNVNALMYYF
jgi:LysM repeat protein